MNIVTLIGRLTKDPELRYMPGEGRAVTSFSIAVNRDYKNKEGKREADFFNIKVWGSRAESCANHLSKGLLVGISGSLQNRTWDKTDGSKGHITEVIADKVDFLEWAKKEKSDDGLKDFESFDDDDIPF